jgi:hypothetical protein
MFGFILFTPHPPTSVDIQKHANMAFSITLPKVHLFLLMISVVNVFVRWGYASVLLAGNENAGAK